MKSYQRTHLDIFVVIGKIYAHQKGETVELTLSIDTYDKDRKPVQQKHRLTLSEELSENTQEKILRKLIKHSGETTCLICQSNPQFEGLEVLRYRGTHDGMFGFCIGTAVEDTRKFENSDNDREQIVTHIESQPVLNSGERVTHKLTAWTNGKPTPLSQQMLDIEAGDLVAVAGNIGFQEFTDRNAIEHREFQFKGNFFLASYYPKPGGKQTSQTSSTGFGGRPDPDDFEEGVEDSDDPRTVATIEGDPSFNYGANIN